MDRIAVVTGGSKGIGLSTVRTLRAEGARVVVASRKSSADLDALAGPGLVHLPVDLTDPAAPATVVAHAVDVFGGLDVLVNNAVGPPPGVSLPRFSFLPLTDDDWREMFEFNLFSAVRACGAAIPVMVERGGGAIVNVSSAVARQPGAVNVDYSAAKAAMTNLDQGPLRGVRPAGRARRHRLPGTGAHPVVDRRGRRRRRPRCRLRLRPRGRHGAGRPGDDGAAPGRLLDPQEVADVIALLASPRSASTTGADVLVDGGFHKGVQCPPPEVR